MKLPDTNVLLNARAAGTPGHGTARAWVERSLSEQETIGFSWVALLGFVRIVTNPRVFDRPLRAADALEQVDEWLDADVATIVQPGREHSSLLGGLLSESGTAGNLSTDAHLAALALENEATLTSFDGDFHRFSKLRFEYLR